MIYIIDHKDSFTHNVVHQFEKFDNVECDNFNKINKDKLSVKDFWQYWRNTSDEDTIKFLLYFTDIKKEEVIEYQNSENDINKLKILLANEVTKLCHGEAESRKAENEAKIILSRGIIDSSVINKGSTDK